MRITRLAGFIAAFVVASFFARSTVMDATAQGATPIACKMLTPGEVSSALGVTALAGAPMLPTRPETCIWPIKPDVAHPGVTMRMEFYVPLGPQTPRQRFEMDKIPANDIPITAVSGLGDDAYYTTSTTTRLVVRKGETVFLLQATGFPKADIEAKEKALALGVLAKL